MKNMMVAILSILSCCSAIVRANEYSFILEKEFGIINLACVREALNEAIGGSQEANRLAVPKLTNIWRKNDDLEGVLINGRWIIYVDGKHVRARHYLMLVPSRNLNGALKPVDYFEASLVVDEDAVQVLVFDRFVEMHY